MRTTKYCALLAAAALLASCSSPRGALTYFEDIETVQPQLPSQDYLVKIQPADELSITVNSTNPEATAPYNVPGINPAINGPVTTNAQPSQQIYVVNSNGDIHFPVLGTIHVAGMTTEQLRDYLVKRISADVEDPIVKVSLSSFYVNVLGEVRSPHRIEVGTDKFTLLDAITAAGDLTPYGKRENVLIIREENGMRKTARLNLNNADILSSPYYYLQQNDVIYVEPTEVRKDNADYNTNNSFKLSVISTIVSACSVIASLAIAISR